MAKQQAAAKQKTLRITQIRSGIGRPALHRATLRALGLRRHQQTVEQQDGPALRGMLFQVRHLVRVEEIAKGEA
jgi:large subunit ribosomal protein L30